ncbi:MAG: sulfite exporter TauE/SafE family protein [Peptococcaceae bacterium]|nr:sulfite exporter TauE/SafE family protein [Peptococcaceae bacterium]
MTGEIGFFAALGLGALHSLEPGHGKGIMGSYLLVSGAGLKDVLALGVTSALTHTLVVLAGSLVLHTAAGAVSTASGLPAARFEWFLSLLSGLLITAIGLSMFRRAVSAKPPPGCGCPAHGGPGRRPSSPLAGAFLVGLSNGLTPCPGSLAVALMSLNTGSLWPGMWVVLAFGIGGAISLVLAGLVFARISSWAGLTGGRGLGRATALAASCLITAIGLVTLTGVLLKTSN